jgi:hypothetical protein
MCGELKLLTLHLKHDQLTGFFVLFECLCIQLIGRKSLISKQENGGGGQPFHHGRLVSSSENF